MPDVRSSVLRFVKYDDEARELDVTLASDKIYRYHNVPPEIYEELLEAESKGGYFNRHIRDAFVCTEVRRRLGGRRN